MHTFNNIPVLHLLSIPNVEEGLDVNGVVALIL